MVTNELASSLLFSAPIAGQLWGCSRVQDRCKFLAPGRAWMVFALHKHRLPGMWVAQAIRGSFREGGKLDVAFLLPQGPCSITCAGPAPGSSSQVSHSCQSWRGGGCARGLNREGSLDVGVPSSRAGEVPALTRGLQTWSAGTQQVSCPHSWVRAPSTLPLQDVFPPPEIIHMLTYLTTKRITKISTKVLHAFYKYVQGL